MTATDRPSDRAIAQAFDEIIPAGDVEYQLSASIHRDVYARARTLDAAPADPVVSAECWRRAIQSYVHEPLCVIEPTLDAIEQRAIELAKEQSRVR